MKPFMFIFLVLFMAGCSTTNLQRKQERVFRCTMNLIQNEVKALNAEKVCTNIFRKKAKKR